MICEMGTQATSAHDWLCDVVQTSWANHSQDNAELMPISRLDLWNCVRQCPIYNQMLESANWILGGVLLTWFNYNLSMDK